MRSTLFIFLILTFACKDHVPHYEYADGSANLYVISSSTLAYFPVTPKESSSGLYDGGELKAVALSSAQYDSLRALLEKAINNPAIHSKERVKMSGAILVIGEYESKQYILQPGCTELAAIEVSLNVLLGR